MASDKLQKTLAILAPLIQQLRPELVITESDSQYALHSETYAAQKNLHPAVVFAPDTVEALSIIVRFLYKSDLDFSIRGRGFKSPSAHDVLISMMKFDKLEYDFSNKLATVGVGQNWAQVAKFMEETDPEYCGTQRSIKYGFGKKGALTAGYSGRGQNPLPWRWRYAPERRLLLAINRVRLHLRPHKVRRRRGC